ncbi:SPOR domain-containing protein [Undibacterium sp. TJN19]|uniref:SPOR domain-containing protein n=1 Tax=Undibacterium sp. TJN19 TaxID=3413055 RepID=UPI003BEF987C
MNAYQKNSGSQQGNTLTGIIVGLVIGLAIAFGVAMLITKSSTPFTNKGKSDKADLPLSQLQDPNKPLYGNKEAAKEAAKEVANTASKAAETHPPVPPVVKPVEVKPEQKTVQEKNADKAADAAKSDGADDKYIYFLQIGAFKEQTAAENSRAKLALIGFEARIVEKTSDSGVMYHVRIGPFTQLESMNRMRSRLSENSVDVAVVRTVK